VTHKRAVQIPLLVFVAASLAYLAVQRGRPGDSPSSAESAVEVAASTEAAAAPDMPAAAEPAAPAEPTPAASTESSQKILAYYFYTTVRCPTCRAIEAFSDEALKRAFPDDLRSGALEWLPVNVQLPQNRHFINDYQLFTKSLIIVRIRDGKRLEWKNLERVWELAGNKQAFLRYVQEEVRAYLRKG
jgi:hypothetical protein